MDRLWAIPLLVLLHWVFLMMVQGRLSALIDFLNARERPLPSGRAVPDLYYPWALIQLNYGFAWYLYRHREPDADVAQHFGNYAHLRRLSNLAFFSHLAMGAVIVGLVLWRQVVR